MNNSTHYVIVALAFLALVGVAQAANTMQWDYTQCSDLSQCSLATQFNIYRDRGCSNNGSIFSTQSVSSLSFSDPGPFTSGESVCYFIKSSNGTEESLPTNVLRFQMPVLNPLPASNLREGVR